MPQHISLVGQVATEPKLFTPEGGAQFCTFRLACTERRYDQERREWVDTDTNWYTVNAFRSLALGAKHSFRTGDRVVVLGRLRVKRWENGEKRGISIEIDAEGLGHDLRWGTTAFTKRDAGHAQPAGQASEGPSSPSAPSDDAEANGVGHSPGAFGDTDALPPATLSDDQFTPSTAQHTPGTAAA